MSAPAVIEEQHVVNNLYDYRLTDDIDDSVFDIINDYPCKESKNITEFEKQAIQSLSHMYSIAKYFR